MAKKFNAVDKLFSAGKVQEEPAEASIHTTEATNKAEAEKSPAEASEAAKRGRPKKWEGNKSSEGEIKASFVISEDIYSKVKEISLREMITKREIVEAALQNLIEKYEERNGTIIPTDRAAGNIKSLFD